MRKSIIVFVFFVLMIVLMVGCAPPTFMAPVKVNVTPDDNITDVSIDIDQNGMKHIVGLKDNRVVYFKGNIGEPTYQFTIGWGLLLPGTDTSTWKQYQPEIAVLDNGTAHIVWWEHHGNLSQKIACHYEVPLIFDPYDLIYCHRLDEPTLYTTGLVRVIAKGNTAYAVYDRLHSSGYVDSVWYKKMEELSSTGLVVSYLDVLEEAYIFSMDLAIDNNGKLHLAYIDEATYSPNPRLYYRSNATTNMDGSMSQNWAIAFGAPGLRENVQPSIDFYNDFVMIASVWENSGNQMIYVDRCNIIDCATKSSISTTSLNADWNSSSEILEVEGLGTFSTYTLSFIGHNDLSSHDQVWYWVSPFSGNPTQVTDTTNAKSQLNMVDGFIPVIGFMENWQVSDPIISYLEKVSIYEGGEGLREVGTYVCPGLSKFNSSDMAAYVDLMSDSIPVAGIWNYCGTTRFSTNAYLIDLPIILK
ncbi:MAG: hypothetical protein Q7U53_15810 [Anaerolineaceae bacterium]|nr:hypothetical protein [Anaerolineaceae bacterium]